jgi:hypothetical protein
MCGAARAIAAVSLVPVAGTAHARCDSHKIAPPVADSWDGRAREIRRLQRWHSYRRSVRWRLTKRGLVLCGHHLVIKPRERYRLDLVADAWERYGPLIRAAAQYYRVPAELIIAVMVNESGLKPKAHQKYRGYVSDDKTPHRISVGLGATLISTARYMLKNDDIGRHWLAKPANAIRMIGVYLNRRYRLTGFDPPKTAAAYNAGSIYADDSRGNRWRMRNYPLHHGIYIDHFVVVANEAMHFFAMRADRPPESLASIFYGPPTTKVAVKVPPNWTVAGGSLVMYRPPPGTKMGVASSSMIDDKHQPGNSARDTVCIPLLSDCSAFSAPRRSSVKRPPSPFKPPR